MWSGPNENDWPAGTTARVCAPPIRGQDSVISPRTTRTAPDDRSWSCQPVSLPRDQQMSQTSTYSSRCRDAKCRVPPAVDDLITPRFRAGSQVVDERGQLV